MGVERMLMQPEVLPTISQTERVSQALHMGETQQVELGGRSIELSGRRQDCTLEPQLSDLFETRRHVTGWPNGARQTDLAEVDVIGSQRNIGY